VVARVGIVTDDGVIGEDQESQQVAGEAVEGGGEGRPWAAGAGLSHRGPQGQGPRRLHGRAPPPLAPVGAPT